MTADSPWVLQFCHGYTPPFLDCARQYAALFAGSPYKVCTVYLTGAPSEEARIGSASDEVIFLDFSNKAIRGLKFGAIRALKRIVASHNFKFCIAHRFKPIYIALLASRLPVLGVQHAFDVYSRRSRQLFVNFFKTRLTLLGVSDAVRDDIRSKLPGWPASRIETLYNRIDIGAVQSEQISREAAREALGLPQEATIIGNVGRLHPDKDQTTLIRGFSEALPRLPENCLLTIMGSGPLEGELKALTEQLGISQHVRFLGQVSGGRRYFKAFDVFALTSDHEPFGMVLLEAMAAGVPIVCSNCGGGREVVVGAGLLTPLGDAKELSEALIQLSTLAPAKLDDLRERMRKRLTEQFSDSAARRNFQTLIDRLSISPN